MPTEDQESAREPIQNEKWRPRLDNEMMQKMTVVTAKRKLFEENKEPTKKHKGEAEQDGQRQRTSTISKPEEYVPTSVMNTPCLDEIIYEPTPLLDMDLMAVVFPSPRKILSPLPATPVPARDPVTASTKEKTPFAVPVVTPAETGIEKHLTTMCKDNSHHATMLREELRSLQRTQQHQHQEILKMLQQQIPPERSLAEDRLEAAGLVGQMINLVSRGHPHRRGFSFTCPLCQENQQNLLNFIRRADAGLLEVLQPNL